MLIEKVIRSDEREELEIQFDRLTFSINIII